MVSGSRLLCSEVFVTSFFFLFQIWSLDKARSQSAVNTTHTHKRTRTCSYQQSRHTQSPAGAIGAKCNLVCACSPRSWHSSACVLPKQFSFKFCFSFELSPSSAKSMTMLITFLAKVGCRRTAHATWSRPGPTCLNITTQQWFLFAFQQGRNPQQFVCRLGRHLTSNPVQEPGTAERCLKPARGWTIDHLHNYGPGTRFGPSPARIGCDVCVSHLKGLVKEPGNPQVRKKWARCPIELPTAQETGWRFLPKLKGLLYAKQTPPAIHWSRLEDRFCAQNLVIPTMNVALKTHWTIFCWSAQAWMKIVGPDRRRARSHGVPVSDRPQTPDRHGPSITDTGGVSSSFNTPWLTHKWLASKNFRFITGSLHFGAAKNKHAMLTIYRCSSTCWHLKAPTLAQIHLRTKKLKTNCLFNQLNSSRAPWLSWKICDFGSCGTRFEFQRGQLFISVSLFFFSNWGQRKISKSFTSSAMTSAHARQWSL